MTTRTPAHGGTRAVVGSRRAEGVGALAVIGGMATLALLRDPHVPGNLGICPSVLLLGVYCPGCGSLRALHDLMHGDVPAAIGHNVLLVPALLFVVVWAVRAIARPGPVAMVAAGAPSDSRRMSLSWRRRLSAVPWAWLLLVVIVVHTVARNIPGSPLAP